MAGRGRVPTKVGLGGFRGRYYRMSPYELGFIFGAVMLCLGLFVWVLHDAVSRGRLGIVFAILYASTVLCFIQYAFRYFVTTVIFKTEIKVEAWIVSGFILAVGAYAIYATLTPTTWFFAYGVLFILATIKVVQFVNAMRRAEFLSEDLRRVWILHEQDLATLEGAAGVLFVFFSVILQWSNFSVDDVSSLWMIVISVVAFAITAVLTTRKFVRYYTDVQAALATDLSQQ